MALVAVLAGVTVLPVNLPAALSVRPSLGTPRWAAVVPGDGGAYVRTLMYVRTYVKSLSSRKVINQVGCRIRAYVVRALSRAFEMGPQKTMRQFRLLSQPRQACEVPQLESKAHWNPKPPVPAGIQSPLTNYVRT